MNIDDICRVYIAAATKFVEARENYRVAFAKAMADSQAKNDTLRKAEADQKTSSLRLTRDKLEIEAAVEWQRLLAARGPMTDSIQPLQKFGGDS
jgi:hypothetical protein